MTKDWLRNAGLLAAGCAFALLLLELFLAFYPPLQPRVRGGKIVLFPHKRYEIKNDRFPRLPATIIRSNNSLGLRGPEPLKTAGDALTVIAVGGSTTEGFYLPDGATWPERFGESLKTAFSASWVNNAGMDGHSTFGHLVFTAGYLTKFRPRAAIYLTGLNDLGKESPDRFDSQLTGGDRGLAAYLFLKAAARSRVLALAQNIYLHSKAIKAGVAHAEIDLKTAPRAEISSAQLAALAAKHKPLAEAYAARLEVIAETARAAGVEPMFLTQPMLCGKGRDPRTGADLETLADTADFVNCRGRWETLELYNGAARRLAAQKGYTLFDLALALPKDSLYYYDTVHFTAEGADKTAELAFAGLCPALSKLSPASFTGCPGAKRS